MALPRKTLFYYSLADLPVSMSMFPVLVFLPKFYTSEMAVDITLAASIMLGVRIFDVVTDPLFGVITDKYPTPWGRRRFWIALAAPIMMISISAVYAAGRRRRHAPVRLDVPVVDRDDDDDHSLLCLGS